MDEGVGHFAMEDGCLQDEAYKDDKDLGQDVGGSKGQEVEVG